MQVPVSLVPFLLPCVSNQCSATRVADVLRTGAGGGSIDVWIAMEGQKAVAFKGSCVMQYSNGQALTVETFTEHNSPPETIYPHQRWRFNERIGHPSHANL